MVYHITVSLAVGSHVENKYCIYESMENHNEAENTLGKHISSRDLICLPSDPNKVNDGKKTSYIMRCKDIFCIAVSEK